MYKWLKKRCSRKSTSQNGTTNEKGDNHSIEESNSYVSLEDCDYHIYSEISDISLECVSLDSGINPLYEEFSEVDSLCHDCPLCQDSRYSSCECVTSDLLSEMSSMWDIYSNSILRSTLNSSTGNITESQNTAKHQGEIANQKNYILRTVSYIKRRPLPPIPVEITPRVDSHNDTSGFFEY
ncbi:hypothetical protein SNE40_019279 [Patella caerulea]|uniref:Uncharacterized protein n=1 Tax=Patella caerulea TaxID=87958 RepID=A0AAN8P9C6_PATCE